MKKLIASVGLAALGVSTLHAQYSPGPTPAEMAKPWSLGLTLRGFYDDNPLTLNKNTPGGVRAVYGEEVSPSASFNHTVNNTAVTLSYIYDFKHEDSIDYNETSHQFKADVKQNFSERYSMEVSDAFIVSEEPTVLPGTSSPVYPTPLHARGDNVHNDGDLSFTAGLVPKLDLQIAYANNLYAYQETYDDVNANPPGTAAAQASYSGLLDRMEQLATINLNWKIMNELTGVLGYSYGNTGYTSPEPIVFGAGATAATGRSTPGDIFSYVRNSDSHFFFVGADEQFTSKLSGSIRVGGEYLDYYNAHADDLSPYVQASMTWTYMKESSLQAGVTHQHSATDVVGAVPANGEPVLDSETTAAYLSMNQKITGGFTGGLLGQYQHSDFNGGSVDGQTEDFFIVGLNFGYRFNEYLNAETGYNWYKLVSDVSQRDYTRNMVYVGVRATY
jgi:hypothetical protein